MISQPPAPTSPELKPIPGSPPPAAEEQAAAVVAAAIPRTPREFIRLRLGIAIPLLMVVMPLILGIFQYRFVGLLLDRFPNDSPEFEAIATTMLQVMGATIIICSISLLFGLAISWAISRPIRRLIRTAQEIATGDLSRTAPTNSGDEFGVLGSSFNQMIASLNRVITERNRYILECYTGGLLIVDFEGHVLAANTSAEQILGEPAQSLVSHPIARILARHPGTEPFTRIIEAALHRRQFVTSQEITIQLRNGKDFPIVVSTSPIRDVGGGKGGVVINFRDLSEIKAFHRKLNRADRLAAIGTLAAGVAHEIRNPLASIKGLAQMLCEESSDESQTSDYAQVIVREVNRLDGVVRELLEFAQADRSETRLYDLNQLVREALEVARWKAPEEKRKGVTVREEYGELPPLPISAERVNRAFLNLLVNAFEACPADGEIAVSTRREAAEDASGGWVIVSIENNGEKITKEDTERIFEPFFSTKPTGTGLGLPIAYQAITSHGGTIDVATTDERTAFIVKFPVRMRETEG
jgi:PAS domain S-box-containing protein